MSVLAIDGSVMMHEQGFALADLGDGVECCCEPPPTTECPTFQEFFDAGCTVLEFEVRLENYLFHCGMPEDQIHRYDMSAHLAFIDGHFGLVDPDSLHVFRDGEEIGGFIVPIIFSLSCDTSLVDPDAWLFWFDIRVFPCFGVAGISGRYRRPVTQVCPETGIFPHEGESPFSNFCPDPPAGNCVVDYGTLTITEL